MICIAVGHDDRVDRHGPRHERRADVAVQMLFLTAIDEHQLARGRLDDRAVALTDVDEPHFERLLVREDDVLAQERVHRDRGSAHRADARET